VSDLFRVSHLNVSFYGPRGLLRAVDDVSLSIAERETVALVGESGCGKSVTALAALRLIPATVGRVEAKELSLRGRDLLALSERQMRRVRGNDVAMIFQEPMSSLNPVFRVGDQVMEVLRLHQGLGGRVARDRAAEALAAVGIPDPDVRLASYPHELSGGMCQRVMIAMAVACRPLLLVADEPTTALDVTIQAQMIALLKSLQDDLGMAVLLITHDLGVVAEMAHRVVVMYSGQVVESAPVGELFERPRHPYTQGLLKSLPRHSGVATRLTPIEGTVPDLGDWGAGCRFAPRCPIAMPECRAEMPALEPVGEPRADPETGAGARCVAVSRRGDV
jgi:oligopeptide/dipeptide ABC transporter ATP-binding protein